MKNLILIAITLFIGSSMFAQDKASRTKINVDESSIAWVGKKVTGEHSGTINLSSGKLVFDENGSLTGGDVVMDMTSLICTDLEGDSKGKLEGHLSSDDFFGVASFPEATLVITEVKKGEGATITITADITIKGITESISFDAEVMDGSAIATMVIDRTKFNIKYGSGSFFEDLGDKTIYDDFELSIKLVF